MSKSKSPYALFGTNRSLEAEGITLDYRHFYLKIARAGGANKAYQAAMKKAMDPHRRAIQTDTMDERLAEALVREVFAQTVVLGWGYRVFDDEDNVTATHDGKMLAADGTVLDFTAENVEQVLKDLPDLYADIREQANKVSLFREQVLEADAGN